MCLVLISYLVFWVMVSRALTHQAAVVTVSDSVLLSRVAILKLGKCKCRRTVTCNVWRTVVVWRAWDYTCASVIE